MTKRNGQPNTRLIPTYATLDEWIAGEAITFAVDSPTSFNAAVDQLVASLGDAVELLGFGEALHGGEEILPLRNRLLQRLVEAHGYSAIALESSFPRGRSINDYVLGRTGRSAAVSYEAVQENGFSHGFGRLEANRDLVEWMRRYNAGPAQRTKLHFYGFDSPTEMTSSDSPRQVLHVALDYLTSLDSASGQAYRQRIDPLLGQDADWENPAVAFDPTKGIGRSAAATQLRIETEELIAELQVRRPELVAKSDEARYREAAHHAVVARQLLTYHAVLAQASSDRIARLLGMRDAMMADNLAYMVAREHGRGKVFVFAHNSHLQRGKAHWQLGPDLLIWWPAGAQLTELLGPRYAVIGSAVGVSEANGLGQPAAGTIEALLAAAPGPVRLIPTHKGQGLPTSAIAALPVRTGSVKNSTYFALTPQSLTDFDWLVLLDVATSARGGPPLP